MPINRLHALFAIPETSQSLALAQLSALKQQVPLLYLILVINGGMLAYTHHGVAPDALVVLPMIVLAVVCTLRAITWAKLDLGRISPERYVPLLRRTNRLTALLCPAFLFWALALTRYGTDVTHLHVFFFLALTPIGCIFCLMHLRSAALIVAMSVTAPDVLFVLRTHEPIFLAIAINLFVVGGVMLYILFIQYRDFVRLAKQNETLAALGDENLRLAATDALTGLPNRRSFFPALEAAVGRTKPFVLGIIDLDGFKGVNDAYGHVAGDTVLAEVADRLCRVIPQGSVLARLGGDEFALILDDEGNKAAEDVGRAILATITLPFACANTNVRIGASIGFARLELDVPAARLVEQADFALYEAKARSRGSWVMFTPELEAQMRLQGAVENALRHADLETELSLAFQPMVDVGQERTIAFEALARWDSPVLGRVPPDRFIAIAERAGLVGGITAVLLDKALVELSRWPADVSLSFNLSMIDITAPDAIDRICEMVGRSEIDPSRLQFEVTETAMLSDFERARAGLNSLKALGARLSLDDFGTGYSSLSHLHRLPVDKLKIDQSFTRELTTSDTARGIVASTIALARTLGLECVVEGVETQEQAIVLRSYGCRLMQGYLFHKPMTAVAVDAYLAEELAQRRHVFEARPLTMAAAVLQRGAMARRLRSTA